MSYGQEPGGPEQHRDGKPDGRQYPGGQYPGGQQPGNGQQYGGWERPGQQYPAGYQPPQPMTPEDQRLWATLTQIGRAHV